MAWVYLLVAAVFELGWPIGLKLGLAESGMCSGWNAFAGAWPEVGLPQQAIPL